jgi:hypothetical protein
VLLPLTVVVVIESCSRADGEPQQPADEPLNLHRVVRQGILFDVVVSFDKPAGSIVVAVDQRLGFCARRDVGDPVKVPRASWSMRSVQRFRQRAGPIRRPYAASSCTVRTASSLPPGAASRWKRAHFFHN